MDNFIVSARKYRPASFVSVIGQSHITSTLKNAISRNQLAHAYLFCGPRGVGKTTCARIFAKAINCLNPKDAEACNECESCKAFNEGRSFNIHELDAASNNSVDDIRNLTDQVRIPPQIGRYSVYIIDEVHMLSLAAFNAFLKTLEEPPSYAVFILATTEKHKIIPTILSRCQIYDFNRIRVEDSVSYLKYISQQEGVQYDEESLHIIAQKADGGMRDALSMFDKVVSFCGPQLHIGDVAATLNVLDYETYFSISDQIVNGNYTGALLTFDEVLTKGFSSQTFIAGLNNHFRDLLMCKNPQTLSLLEVTGSVADKYRTQATNCPVPLLFEGINLLTALDASLRMATNQRLSVELGLMKLCGLGQKKNDDTLVPALPPLESDRLADSQRTGVASTISATAMPIANAAPISAGTSAPEAITLAATPSAVVTPHQAAPTPETASLTTPLAAVSSQPNTAATENQVSQQQKQHIKSPVSLSGNSISSILSSSLSTEDNSDEETPDINPMEIDPQIEELLEKGCSLFSREIRSTRPRLAIALSEVKVSLNKVTVSVPNASLYDEITRNLTEIQKHLMELSGVRSPIEFEITIDESNQDTRPFKLEDRLRYLTEKNPLISTLISTLNMEPE